MQIVVALCFLSAASALRLAAPKDETLTFVDAPTDETLNFALADAPTEWGFGENGWMDAASGPAAGGGGKKAKPCDNNQTMERDEVRALSWNKKPAEKCNKAEEDLYIRTMGHLDTQFEFVKEMKGMGFNAALSELPASMKKTLGNGVRDAQYIYIPKLSHDQCKATCANDHGTKWRVDEDNGIMDRDYVSAVYILNSKFEPVLGPVTKDLAEDMRVLTVGNELLVDYHYKGANWEVRQLDLSLDHCNDLKVEYKPIKWGNYQRLLAGGEAQNVQLIPHQNSLYSIWWESQTAVTEVRKIGTDGSNNPVNFARKERVQVHGSVHPLFLPEVGAYLSAAHYSRKQGEHGYEWGSEYVQFLTLHDADPPFSLVKRTRDFCFASFEDGFSAKFIEKAQSKSTKCEIMQFVSSIIRDPKNPSYLLLSVGIHDCRSLLLKVPLSTIVDAMDPPPGMDETPALNFARISKGAM